MNPITKKKEKKMAKRRSCSAEHHVRRSFLEDMPLSIKRYRYRGKEHLLYITDLEFNCFQRSKNAPRSTNAPSEYILFQIDGDTFARDFLDPTVNDIPSISAFDTDENLVLIKMHSQEHAHAADTFASKVMNKIRDMGLETQIQRFPGTTITAGNRGKQADQGWGPIHPPPGYDRKPTVVLEVAVSESQAKLERDVQFWLDPAQGNANIALTLKINRKRPVVTIEKWQWDGANDRTQRVQRIEIAESPSGDRITVSNAPLIIPFELLMRRTRSSPAEVDITIDVQDLEEIADGIWIIQEF